MITTNSLGQRIAKTDEQIAAFWRWFGKSKVVDAEGRPLVVYHGTDAKFNKINFRKGAQGVFWFASDPVSITAGESGAQGVSRVMALYARIENPADWKQYDNLMLDEFRGRGLDGAILPTRGGCVGFVIASPTQIKSATGNRGTFSASDPVITNPPMRRHYDFSRGRRNKYARRLRRRNPTVYHGTGATFTAFTTDRVGQAHGMGQGWGVYFTNDVAVAQAHAGKTGHVYTAKIPRGHGCRGWAA